MLEVPVSAGESVTLQQPNYHVGHWRKVATDVNEIKRQLDEYIYFKTDGIVQTGPFAGMKLMKETAWCEAYLTPMLLGCYEEELHGEIERQITRLKKFEKPRIAIIGAAEGYYAIGFKRRIPHAEVFVVEPSDASLTICRDASIANDTPLMLAALDDIMKNSDFILMDCEGNEVAYCNLEKWPNLCGMHMLIEVHNFDEQRTDDILVQQFRGSHRITMLVEGPRNPNKHELLVHMTNNYRWMAMSEGRGCLMGWFVMEPKGLLLSMRVGIIGLGMVGEAVAYGLRRIGHEVVGYDTDPKKQSASFASILKTELVFVCVPTPTVDFKCDDTVVWAVVTDLNTDGYRGLIVIKSTVPPGTTVHLHTVFPDRRLAFCPEFLRERARFSDFVDNHELCVAGVFNDIEVLMIREAHGNLPKNFVKMAPTEAELLKYFVNCFNAYRVNFANAFYDVCKAMGADYSVIKDAVTKRSGISPDYLTCNEQTRAFGGACLPKDTEAFASFVRSFGLYTGVFDNIVWENERLKNGYVTVGDFKEEIRE